MTRKTNGTRMEKLLRVRVTQARHRAYAEQAGAEGRTLSSWARRALDLAAGLVRASPKPLQ